MKKFLFISLAFIIILISLFKRTSYYIKPEDVQLVIVDNKQYISEKDMPQIKNIISMYNEAKSYRNDLGTTPTHNIVIKLKDGQIISISGSTQGYQTVNRNNKQYNITNDKLLQYFKSLD